MFMIIPCLAMELSIAQFEYVRGKINYCLIRDNLEVKKKDWAF